MGMLHYYDATYILVLAGVVLSIWASARVNSTFQKYAGVYSRAGITGAQAAERILHGAGIYDVGIAHVRGTLTDHYDPGRKVLCLSDSTFQSTSVAAIGVAAHECGHAIQHQKEYLPLKIRSFLVPAANLGSRLGVPIILAGILFGLGEALVPIGIWVFSLSVLFQIVTLPVEFNASNRAVEILDRQGMLTTQELPLCKKVLRTAAFTYVAAAAASILQLLRLILLFGGGRRRND